MIHFSNYILYLSLKYITNDLAFLLLILLFIYSEHFCIINDE